MKQDPQEMYKIAVEGRREDSNRYWTVFTVMASINGAMLAFIRNEDELIISLKALSLLGVAICVVWFLLQRRLSGWVRWWEVKLEEMEKGKDTEIHLFTNRKGAVPAGVSTRIAGAILPVLFALSWVLVGLRITCG